MSQNIPHQNADSTETSANSHIPATPNTGFRVHNILGRIPSSMEDFVKKQKDLALEREKDEMRQKKFAVLAQYSEFNNENIRNHPSISTIIQGNSREEKEKCIENLDTDTIFRYVARQNIVCTFYCDEVLTTGTDRVDELAKIYTNKTDGKFPHLTLWTSDRAGFAEEWQEKKKNDPNYASQYFLVHLHNEAQNEGELQRFVEEFKEICNNFITKNDKK